MPKKHRQTNFSKPPSTAPSSLQSRSSNDGASRNDGNSPRPTVNALLDNLRRQESQDPSNPVAPASMAGAPSVPPEIRRALGLPPASPRQPLRPSLGPGGIQAAPAPPGANRRLPPRLNHLPQQLGPDGRPRIRPAGPPPPGSWVRAEEERMAGGWDDDDDALIPHGALMLHRGCCDTSRFFSPRAIEQVLRHLRAPNGPLEGRWCPALDSLVDVALHGIVDTWAFQRTYNVSRLYHLPHHLREALLRYLSIASSRGSGNLVRLTLDDLAVLLRPPEQSPPTPAAAAAVSDSCAEEDDNWYDGLEMTEFEEDTGNLHFRVLDLSCAIGESLTPAGLKRILFPRDKHPPPVDPPAHWAVPSLRAWRCALLPNLSHLSLALTPGSEPLVSWPQLLSLSEKLGLGLKQLSLACWPRPSYSFPPACPEDHENDWDDAIAICQTLHRNLYRLQRLDLVGCNWSYALLKGTDIKALNWNYEWGQMEKVKLYPTQDGPDLCWQDGPLKLSEIKFALQSMVRARRKSRGGGNRFEVE